MCYILQHNREAGQPLRAGAGRLWQARRRMWRRFYGGDRVNLSFLHFYLSFQNLIFSLSLNIWCYRTPTKPWWTLEDLRLRRSTVTTGKTRRASSTGQRCLFFIFLFLQDQPIQCFLSSFLQVLQVDSGIFSLFFSIAISTGRRLRSGSAEASRSLRTRRRWQSGFSRTDQSASHSTLLPCSSTWEG